MRDTRQLRSSINATLLLVLLLTGGIDTAAQAAGTVESVRNRGELRCGVADRIPGIADQDADGRWHGIEADFCRAVAAAVLEDPEKVRFVPLRASTRFPALLTRRIDLLLATTTWTLSREALLGARFPAVLLYDGQSFMVPAASAAREPADLRDATICVEKETTHSARLADFAARADMDLQPLVAESANAAAEAFFAGRCAALTMESTQLAALRQRAGMSAADYRILPTAISREPLSPVVRGDDQTWASIVRWIVHGLVLAEEAGIDSRSAEAMQLPTFGQAWGVSNEQEFALIAQALGLRAGWQLRSIRAVGNYRELFERNLGSGSALRLERGANRLARDGGLHYAPPLK
jgi:general L-amino acid transport system substrate-binding protein